LGDPSAPSLALPVGFVGDGMKEDERARSLGIRGGVQRGHRAAFVRRQQNGVRGARAVEDRVQVLHPRLEGAELPAVIGETRPALVEENQSKRLGKLLVEGAPVPRLPAVDEVRHEIRDIREVGLTVAHELVGDCDATVARVPDVCRHSRIFSNAVSAAKSSDLDDPDVAADEACARGPTAGDDLESVVGRAGDSIGRRTAAASAGGVDLGLDAVRAAAPLEDGQRLPRRRQGSRWSGVVLAEQNQDGKPLLGCRAMVFLTVTTSVWVPTRSVVCAPAGRTAVAPATSARATRATRATRARRSMVARVRPEFRRLPPACSVGKPSVASPQVIEYVVHPPALASLLAAHLLGQGYEASTYGAQLWATYPNAADPTEER